MVNSLDIRTLYARLPHRYPFLLLDRLLTFEVGKQATALKNVSINEPFFQGHFPAHPIMPGVLLIEAMAQLGGILLLPELDVQKNVALLAGVDKTRFRRQVIPGDQLLLHAEVLRVHGTIGKVAAKIEVEQQLVTEAELLFSVVPWTESEGQT